MKELELSLRLLLVGDDEKETTDLAWRIVELVALAGGKFPIAFLDCKQVKR
jgi:hypothetical protein